jgi:carbonic anhydrase/acetyltransferase-like protein (isoleucine patch superfamily)
LIYRLEDRVPVLEGDGQFIAHNATIVGSVRLKANVSVWFNAVLRGDNEWIVVGADSNIQDGAILHADPGIPLNIGDRVTAGHKVMLHGCTIGDNTTIGIGSIILNHAKVGRNSIVGANSLITQRKEFPDGVLIMGSPATVTRELSDEEIQHNTWSANHYVENGHRYLAHLKKCGGSISREPG